MISDNSPRQQYIRMRGETNQEARVTLAIGAPMALRTMVRDHADRLNEIALQLGFEMWKRDGKEIPLCSGVISRPGGMPEDERLRGVDAANALADRVLDIYLAGGPSKSAGALVNDLFLFVQWRIARIARMRAERADREGKTVQSLKDVNISDRLDHHNAGLKRILRDMDKARERTLKSVTPRESLQLALARLDFTLARRYAELILEDDPNDPDANFGVGMSYYTLKQWARAEEYLRRCLIKRPRQPAVWNNLGMICMFTERYEEGLGYAKRALSIIPDSAEVKDTIKQIEEAWKAAKGEGAGDAKKPDTAKKPDATKKPDAVKKNEPAKKPDVVKKQEAAKKPDAVKKQEPAKKQEKSQQTESTNEARGVVPPMASPREELEKAIANGDFEAAADHAKLILLIDADDPDANFAVGMNHFGKRQWAKAEESLKLSLEKRPNDPVTLNNLAITCLYQQHYDEALKYAEKARDALPNSADIEDTLNQIKRLKESAGKGKPEAKKPAKKKPVAQKPAKKKTSDGDAKEALKGLEGTVPSK